MPALAPIAVVTAITGGRDRLLMQRRFPGVEYIAFMDDELIYDVTWKVRRVYQKFKDPVMNAKIHKILTHKFVDTPYIVWMDGNRSLKRDPRELVEMMGDYDFAFFEHYGRHCLYKEIRTCLSVRKGASEELLEQGEAYKSEGFPPNSGLCDCGAFVRKNNDNANRVFESWWAEVCRYSNRDQVSFPKIFKDQKWLTIPGKLFYEDNEFFDYHKHL